MKHSKSHEIDMLHGALLPKILMFAMPLAFSNALQILFNAADVIVVGRFAGALSLAAVGATTSLVNLVVNFFIGITMGANIYFASGYAAGKRDLVEKGVHTAIAFSLVTGVIVGAIGILSAGSILQLMGSPEDILDMSSLYVRIYCLGMPAVISYNFGSAALRSIGDTQRPMAYLLFSGVVNIILNLVTVIGLGLGVAGVAIATTVSNYISACLVLGALVREESMMRLDPKKLRIDKKALKDMLRLGIPSGIQSSMFGIANVLIQSSVNSFGSTCIAGNAASANMEGFILAVVNAMAAASLTFASQNVGAGYYRRADQTLKTVILSGSLITFLMGLIVAFFRRGLISVFNADPDVIAMGSIRLLIMAVTYWLEVPMQCFSSAMRALKHTVEPMVVSVGSICIFRIIYLHTVFRIWHEYVTIAAVWPVSWVLAILVSMIVYRKIRRRFPDHDLVPGAQSR